jgi:hypothetical protein
MDIVDLPLVTTEHSLRQAIEGMQRTDRRAVVLQVDSELYVCTNRDVAAAWKKGLRQCSQLAEKIRRGGSSRARLAELPDTGEARQLEKALDSRNVSYGLLTEQILGVQRVRGIAFDEVASPEIPVVTRHEGLAYDLRAGTKVCMCTGPMEHTGESPPLRPGAPCNDCNAGVYECF